jgi:hypothetical protein
VTEELRQQFREINIALATVVANEGIDHRSGIPKLSEKTQSAWEATLVMLPKIEAAVQKRLHYDQA